MPVGLRPSGQSDLQGYLLVGANSFAIIQKA
jgi:hypothetical protein